MPLRRVALKIIKNFFHLVEEPCRPLYSQAVDCRLYRRNNTLAAVIGKDRSSQHPVRFYRTIPAMRTATVSRPLLRAWKPRALIVLIGMIPVYPILVAIALPASIAAVVNLRRSDSCRLRRCLRLRGRGALSISEGVEAVDPIQIAVALPIHEAAVVNLGGGGGAEAKNNNQ